MKKLFLLLIATGLFSSLTFAQDPKLTEDWTRKPAIVTPGCQQSPPSDAIVLFGKAKDISNWVGRTGPAKWKTSCRKMMVNGTGDIMTKEKFGDCQLHVEFRTPRKVIGEGQGRGNSGVYIQTLYEVQVLDSYINETYYNGQAGAVYKQSPPLVNVLWGLMNFLIGYVLIFRVGDFSFGLTRAAAMAGLGVLVTSIVLSLYFERVYSR